MKKFITFVFIFHIFFSPNLFAVEKYVVGGINASQFYNIISKPMTGYTVGVGWEWGLGQSSALLFTPGYFSRSGKLENKVVYSGGAIYAVLDMECHVGYFELPLTYRQYFRNRSLFLSLGCSFCLAVYDGSDTNTLYSGVPLQRPVDFNFNIDPGMLYQLYSSTIDLSFGVGVKRDHFDLGFYTRLALGDTGSLDSIKVGGKFISLSVISSWYF
ncbi:hypothetical protein GF406_14020 [candidate division KSB1 bacterium]|nr:hypothetical protein [candidate division KSB1 bacterium]